MLQVLSHVSRSLGLSPLTQLCSGTYPVPVGARKTRLVSHRLVPASRWMKKGLISFILKLLIELRTGMRFLQFQYLPCFVPYELAALAVARQRCEGGVQGRRPGFTID